MRVLSASRKVGSTLLLTLTVGACSDLPFGPVHGGPSDHLLLVADGQVVRLSLRSGNRDRVARFEGLAGHSRLAERSPILHVGGFGREIISLGLAGVDVCRRSVLYHTRPHRYPLTTLELSHDETELYFWEYPVDEPSITVASARTGEPTRQVGPMNVQEMRRIPPGRAYPDGAQAMIGVRPGGVGHVFIMSPDLAEVRDSIGVADLQAGPGLEWIAATADGESLYVDTYGWIVRYDLVTKQPTGMAGYSFPPNTFAFVNRTLGPEGTVVVAESGSPYWPTWGEVLVFSPDLQQVDTVDISTPLGDDRRQIRGGVIDVERRRIYLLSPEGLTSDPRPWKLLVLDLDTREFIRSIDIGSWRFVPGIHLHPDC